METQGAQSMGRKQVVLTALLLLAIVILTGCPGSNPAAPINNTSRNYGPPFNPIIFNDGAGFLATISSDVLTENPDYVDGFGLNEAISDMAYGFLIRPNSSEASSDFAAFDLDTEMLHVVDSQGSVTSSYFDGDAAEENMFAFSNVGSRLVYVRAVNNQHQLIYTGILVDVFYEITTIASSRRFFGRPTMSSNTSIAMMSIDANQQTRIEVYNLEGTIEYQLTT
ncbi:MAG TPA: hypothetical protein ENH10_02410, partial [Bacteroidetes bacterium]|nr:hypothetical protein [Bacteroidota bacterium]HEX03993.1 hypothetical protein [Bacteroidota bacterium]